MAGNSYYSQGQYVVQNPEKYVGTKKPFARSSWETAFMRFCDGHPNIVPYNLFETKDGEIALSVGNDRQFEKFSALIKKPEWSSNEKFKTNEIMVTYGLSLIHI